VKRRGFGALLAAACFAMPSVPAAAASLGSTALTPVAILERYEASLAALKRPRVLSFDYSVEQLGLKNMEQTHHVYRSGLSERDETLVVDGFTLPRPAVRIIANRLYRYDIDAVAPTSASYAFQYSGVALDPDGDGSSYVFRTKQNAVGAFTVSEIEIDTHTFLPKVVRFKISGDGAHGSGELLYGRAESYWVVRQAQVNAHLTNGALAHERITWSNYQFPIALPPSTFEVPRATTIDPEALATPQPTSDPGQP
jgi:hypothetical protein